MIKKLLNKKGEERLGYNKGLEEIKNHHFFKGFNFDNLFDKKIESPYKPNINNVGNMKIIRDKYTYGDLIKYGMENKN